MIEIRPSILIKQIIFLMVILISSPLTYASFEKYTRSITSSITGYESRLEAKKEVLEMLQVDLFNEIGIALYSETNIRSDSDGREFGTFEVRAITAGIIKTKILSEEWTSTSLSIKAILEVDTTEVKNNLKVIDELIANNLKTGKRVPPFIRAEVSINDAGRSSPVSLYFEAEQLMKKNQIEAAINLYAEAGDAGFILAYHRLGLIYLDGEGVLKNLTESMYWFEKGAYAGVDHSQYALAVLLSAQSTFTGEVDKSIYWSKVVFNSEEKRYRSYASLILALIYSDSVWKFYDETLAVYYFSEASNNQVTGEVSAELLGRYYMDGSFSNTINISKIDISKSIKWFEKSIAYGNQISTYWLGTLYSSVIQQSFPVKLPVNDQLAMKLFKVAAEKYNIPNSYIYLYGHLQYGIGTEKDLEKAFFWLKKAANQNENLEVKQLARDILNG